MTQTFWPKPAGVFGPQELAKMATAFDTALSAATDSAHHILPGRTLRHLVAASIVAEARRGDFDPDRLTKAALEALSHSPAAASAA
jgi:hypothetical protein